MPLLLQQMVALLLVDAGQAANTPTLRKLSAIHHLLLFFCCLVNETGLKVQRSLKGFQWSSSRRNVNASWSLPGSDKIFMSTRCSIIRWRRCAHQVEKGHKHKHRQCLVASEDFCRCCCYLAIAKLLIYMGRQIWLDKFAYRWKVTTTARTFLLTFFF